MLKLLIIMKVDVCSKIVMKDILFDEATQPIWHCVTGKTSPATLKAMNESKDHNFGSYHKHSAGLNNSACSWNQLYCKIWFILPTHPLRQKKKKFNLF